MKHLTIVITLCCAVAGCTGGVSTGRRSPCAGPFQSDGSYAVAPMTAPAGSVVSRNSTSMDRMSFVGEGGDDCVYTSF